MPLLVVREELLPPLAARARARTKARTLLIGTRPEPPAYERVPTQPQPFCSKLSAMESTRHCQTQTLAAIRHPPAPWRGGAVSNRPSRSSPPTRKRRTSPLRHRHVKTPIPSSSLALRMPKLTPLELQMATFPPCIARSAECGWVTLSLPGPAS